MADVQVVDIYDQTRQATEDNALLDVIVKAYEMILSNKELES
jgi:hypothetical protein